jgi:hypothetical protein
MLFASPNRVGGTARRSDATMNLLSTITLAGLRTKELPQTPAV